MTSELEELVNDPGNHAVLKALAAEEKMHIQQLSDQTGIPSERLRDKISHLEEQNFLDVEKGQTPSAVVLNQRHRESLEQLRSELESFHGEKAEVLQEKNQEEVEYLQEVRDQLREELEDTDVMKRQRKLRSRLELVEEALNRLNEADSSEDHLEAFSLSHRVLRSQGAREDEFEEFNPFRKLKACRKLDEILGREPEEEEVRMFFGNRWVTEDSL